LVNRGDTCADAGVLHVRCGSVVSHLRIKKGHPGSIFIDPGFFFNPAPAPVAGEWMETDFFRLHHQ
jgi:hypothetical protein